jgi:hypothetical protein
MKARKMSKVTTIAVPALLTAMAVGTAASAAPGMHRHHSKTPVTYAGFGEASLLKRDIVRLDKSIDRALASRRISSEEAAILRFEAKGLEELLSQFRRAGLTRDDARMIQVRIAQIDGALRADRRRWRN